MIEVATRIGICVSCTRRCHLPIVCDERGVGGDDGAGALEAFIADDRRVLAKPRFLGCGTHDGFFDQGAHLRHGRAREEADPAA